MLINAILICTSQVYSSIPSYIRCSFLACYFPPQIVGSLVEVHGALEFYRNEVASLELLSSAQVQLKEGARMEFTENTGRCAS